MMPNLTTQYKELAQGQKVRLICALRLIPQLKVDTTIVTQAHTLKQLLISSALAKAQLITQ